MLMTVRGCAEELHTSPSTVYRCIRAGAPCRRFGPSGRGIRVDPDLLLDWMDEIRHIDEVVLDVQAMADQRRALVGR